MVAEPYIAKALPKGFKGGCHLPQTHVANQSKVVSDIYFLILGSFKNSYHVMINYLKPATGGAESLHNYNIVLTSEVILYNSYTS